MASKELPAPELLRKLLDYNPETGLFAWRERDASLFAESSEDPQLTALKWNARFSGKPTMLWVGTKGYLEGMVMRTAVKAHRVAWAIYYDEWPRGHIDHINHNRRDNRIVNLRVVTPLENNKNRQLMPINSSGVIGVTWRPEAGKWVARISENGRLRHLGYFEDFDEAVKVRKGVERENGYHENHGLPPNPHQEAP